jgi:hypothetical protein
MDMSAWFSPIKKLFSPAFICFLFYTIYIAITLADHSWDPMALVRVGGHFDPRVGGQEMGYDGQFGYQIALDPLQGWQYVDIPAYRYQRILYPLLARAVSFGQAEIIPWGMLLINFIAAVMSVWLLEKILRTNGYSPWFALSFGLFIGTLMSIRLNLNEPLAYLLAILGIYLIEKSRMKWAILAFTLAALSKEIIILFPLAFGLEYLIKERMKSAAAMLLAIIPLGLWKTILFFWLHDWGLNSGGAMATPFEWLPYAGWWKLAMINFGGFLQISLVILPLVILPSILGIWISFRRLIHKTWTADVFLVLFYAGLIPFLPMSNIVDPMGISRMLMSLIIGFLYLGAKQKSISVLKNSLLFCLTSIFIWKDAFLPVGTYRE